MSVRFPMAHLQSYELLTDTAIAEVQLPVNAQVLAFINIDEKPFISVLVDVTSVGRELRKFLMAPLKSIVDTSSLDRFIGVAVFRKGANPIHLFEIKKVLLQSVEAA